MPAENSDRARSKRKPGGARTARGRTIVHALLLLVAAVIIADTLVGDRGLVAMLRARRQYEELSATLMRERADNARLREQARRLRHDPKAIEEVARRELGLIRPGEKLFIVHDVPPPAAPPSRP